MTGRRKKLDPPARLNVKIPSSLLHAVEDALFDAGENRIPYGARADVMTALLRAWLKGQDGGKYYRLVDALIIATTEAEKNLASKALVGYHVAVRDRTNAVNLASRRLDLSDLMG